MRRGILGYGLALLLTACTSSHGNGATEPLPGDSETHFLTLCDSRCPDDLTCVCGACTQPCDDASACGDFGEAASCEAPHAADRFSCGRQVPAAVCEVQCSADADCAAVGAEHRCDRGVCRAPPRAATTCPATTAPQCEAGEHLRAQSDGDGCTSAICEPDLECSTPPERNGACDAGFSGFTYVSERGRCEEILLGGCRAPTSSNFFESVEACWASCEVGNTRDECLEGFERIDPGDGALVDGVDVPGLLDRMEGTHRAALRYPDDTRVPLQVTVSGAIAYRVSTTYNTNPRSAIGLPIMCRNRLQVEADVTFAVGDGTFDERWKRVPFEVLPDGRARARLSLKRAGVPSNDFENTTLQGSYVPDIEPNTCDLIIALSMTFGSATFSGEIGFLIANAACEDVVGTTAVGQGSPPGPSWLAIDAAGGSCEDGACCVLLAVDECGMAPQCDLVYGWYYDADRMCRERQAAGCLARQRICTEEEVPARDAEDTCWLFANGCVPSSFSDDPQCGDVLRAAPACE